MWVIYLIVMALAYSIPVNIIKAVRTQNDKELEDYMFLAGIASALLYVLSVSRK